MSLEINLLFLIWVIGVIMIAFGVPSHKRHSFFVAFLTAQGMEWLAEILLLQFNVVSFPVREFPKASEMSITLMIFLLPLCCATYVIYEPKKKSWPIRILYLAFWANVMTWMEIMISHFTDLQDHKSYYWLVAMLLFSFELIVANAVVRWFFHNSSLLQRDRRTV